jgi:hypothetical protein
LSDLFQSESTLSGILDFALFFDIFRKSKMGFVADEDASKSMPNEIQETEQIGGQAASQHSSCQTGNLVGR